MSGRKFRADGTTQNSRSSGYSLERVIWIIAIVAMGMFVAYKLLSMSKGNQASQEASKTKIQAESGKKSTGQQANGQKATSGTSVEGKVPGGTVAGGSTGRVSQGYEGSRTTARGPRRIQPGPSDTDVQKLISALMQIKPVDGKFSPEQVNEINRLIRELKQQGPAGVMAICEFLQSGQDVSFANFAGKTLPEYGSLRLALIDVLGQMGGSETAAFMAGMLKTTSNPEEIALLAKGLEYSAPGTYRAEIMQVARTMLDQAVKATPGQYPGLGHLFSMIQEYGDATIAADLEKMYRNSPSTFTELSLMALSKLPEGTGVPSLLKIVNEMSGNPGAYGATYEMALRYLTQASRESPEAGEALLGLASANKINTAGLIQVANALGGTEHELITKTSDISLQSRAETKISMRAAETWSDIEIDERLGLIDQLLRTNPQPAAVKALQDARNRLQVWRTRPMVNGKRITR